jgi:hypothetical protein
MLMFARFGKVSFLYKIKTPLLAFVAALSLFVIAVPQVSAQDQSSITFTNATLSIYPEYDDPLNLGNPSVLVMYDGKIVSNNLSKLTFLVPSSASMYSAGSGPREQYVVGASLNRTASNISGWDEVSFIPRTNYFVVEYYAPIQGQPDRSLPFEFRTLYPISGMNVVVQQPARSTSFKVSPEGTLGSDSEGFTIHSYNNLTVNPGQPLLYNISYTKQNTTPSKGGSSSTSSNTTLIVIVIGAIVVLGAGLFFLPQLRAQSKRTGSRSQRRQAERAAAKDQGKNKFCRNCGKPVKDNDRFCPACGKLL